MGKSEREMQRCKRTAYFDGDARPEIFAEPCDDGWRSDHGGLSPPFTTPARPTAYAKAILKCWNAVSIRDPERVMRAYPHEMSGGMGQRIMIAMMLIPNPEILIADEPLRRLDVSVQRKCLAIIDKLGDRTRHGPDIHQP
jgi:ABC-type dipeptide/oligopeptide/nickel transport system ATPase component